MPRQRVRAAARKVIDQDAHMIGSGVFSIAVDLKRAGVKLPLPIFAWAPLVYICEMLASVLCANRAELADEQDDVARYLMAGLQEFTVQLFESFDVEHYRVWINAAKSGE